MNGSPSAILTLGLGSWGSSSLLLTLGLGVGAEAEVPVFARSCTVAAFSRRSVPAFVNQSKPSISRQSVPDTECCQ